MTLEEISKKWNKAEDWTAMLKLNVKFLSGEDTQTIYHGDLDPETIPLIPGLLRLHQLGLLTICSQPAYEPEPSRIGQSWYQIEQHAFVEFVLPYRKTITNRFILSLLNDKQIKTRVFDYGPSGPTLWAGSRTKRVKLTLERKANSKEELEEMEWKCLTSFPDGGEVPPFYDTALEETEVAKNERLLLFWLATLKNIDLLERVREHAVEARLPIMLQQNVIDTAISQHIGNFLTWLEVNKCPGCGAVLRGGPDL